MLSIKKPLKGKLRGVRFALSMEQSLACESIYLNNNNGTERRSLP